MRLTQQPFPEAPDLGPGRVRLWTYDPVGELGWNFFRHRPNQPAGAEVQARQGTACERNTLTGDSRVDGEAGLVEDGAAVKIERVYGRPDRIEPVCPSRPIPIMDQHVLGQIMDSFDPAG